MSAALERLRDLVAFCDFVFAGTSHAQEPALVKARAVLEAEGEPGRGMSAEEVAYDFLAWLEKAAFRSQGIDIADARRVVADWARQYAALPAPAPGRGVDREAVLATVAAAFDDPTGGITKVERRVLAALAALPVPQEPGRGVQCRWCRRCVEHGLLVELLTPENRGLVPLPDIRNEWRHVLNGEICIAALPAAPPECSQQPFPGGKSCTKPDGHTGEHSWTPFGAAPPEWRPISPCICEHVEHEGFVTGQRNPKCPIHGTAPPPQGYDCEAMAALLCEVRKHTGRRPCEFCLMQVRAYLRAAPPQGGLDRQAVLGLVDRIPDLGVTLVRELIATLPDIAESARLAALPAGAGAAPPETGMMVVLASGDEAAPAPHRGTHIEFRPPEAGSRETMEELGRTAWEIYQAEGEVKRNDPRLAAPLPDAAPRPPEGT